MDKFWAYIQDKNEPSKSIAIFRRLYLTNDERLGEIREEFNSWTEDDLVELYQQLEYLQCEDDVEFILGDGGLDLVNEAIGQADAPLLIWNKVCRRKSKNFF